MKPGRAGLHNARSEKARTKLEAQGIIVTDLP